ncbi:hypothetical protein PVAND_009181 [Polypedilum vanderplanki]|uniref:Uncharacterized protein n=1 Tax=Polypedilum vanderplanki TaxID=319348 RepID=A0A9J6CCH7_POLVA|nr:hypothetical protein PVAND_009181 [Polypedilum vanderplanki]
MFIIFCLIIRTAYQGVLFELMRSQPRRPEPKDFQGLIEQNYKLYTNIETENFTWEYLKFFGKEIEFKKRLFIKITEEEALKIYGTQWNNGSAKLSLILQKSRCCTI